MSKWSEKLQHFKERFSQSLKKFSRKGTPETREMPGPDESKQEGQPKKARLNVMATLRKLKSRASKSGGGPSKFSTNFSWRLFFQRLFSPYYRQYWHRAFVVGMFVLIPWAVGSFFSSFVSSYIKGPRPQFSRPEDLTTESRPLPEEKFIDPIIETNLFGLKENDRPKKEKKEKKKVDKDKVCLDANQKSNLNIELLNTIVLQNAMKSLATVSVGRDEVQDVREGEVIGTFAEVGKIKRLQVIIKNLQTNDCEYIATDELEDRFAETTIYPPKKGRDLIKKNKNQGIVNDGDSFRIKKAVRDDILKDISKVMTQAKAVPIKNPDGTLSFKMTEIVPGSIYSKLNIQNGDIIQGINGQKFKNYNQLMGLFNRIQSIDNFEITLKRNGEETTQEYNFE